MGEFVRSVGPVKVGELELAFLVVVGLAVVAVEVEVCVGTGVDTDLVDLLFLVGALDCGAKRKDRAGSNKERNDVDGSIDSDCLTSCTRSFVQKLYQSAPAGR